MLHGRPSPFAVPVLVELEVRAVVMVVAVLAVTRVHQRLASRRQLLRHLLVLRERPLELHVRAARPMAVLTLLTLQVRRLLEIDKAARKPLGPLRVPARRMARDALRIELPVDDILLRLIRPAMR